MTTIKTKPAPATSEAPAPVKRTRKKRDAPTVETHALVPVLKWLMQAQNGAAHWASHCHIKDGWATAYDGAVAAGHKVNVDWFAQPKTSALLAALEHASADASMVVDNTTLTVLSGRMTVRVPCLDMLPEIILPPEKSMAIDGAALLDALRRVIVLCKEGATTVVENAIDLNEGCATATNRNMLLQTWHGLEMPRMILPRAAAAILLKQDAPTGVMWDVQTVTFSWPEKWLRFNLYDASTYPDVSKIFKPDNPLPVPNELKTAIAALMPHAADGRLFLENDESFEGLRTSDDAAIYHLPLNASLPVYRSIGLRADMLKIMADVASIVDFNADDRVQFYGDGLRGALAHVGVN